MYKYLVVLTICFCCSVNHSLKKEISGDNIYNSKWNSVIKNIQNFDSLLCKYIETNTELEICMKTFERLSAEQKFNINLAMRYSGSKILFFKPDSKEPKEEHPKRLSFMIYDKYYDQLSAEDLALELTISTSRYEGHTYLYLLERKDSGYMISHLLGSRKM